jgi:hypothetical protein
VLYLAFPDRLYFEPMGGILSKMYANTMLMVLNSRIEKLGRGSYTTNLSAQFYPGSVGDTALQQGSGVSYTREVVLSGADMRDQVEMKIM